MQSITTQAVQAALRQCTDPHLKQDVVSAGWLRDIQIQGGAVSVHLALGYAADLFKSDWAQQLQRSLAQSLNVERLMVKVDSRIEAHRSTAAFPALAGVKNIIAVASGKGGVGKSTTAANLALALSREGAQVGLLDADIYGPSQGIMFGLSGEQRPEVRDQKFFVPLQAHGVSLMSMAFLTDDNTPVVWRGPMVSGALLQLLGQTTWGTLDYLVVDMPPGTGDIQLTLAQKVPVAGAVIVTTPQDLALLDAKKGVEMFRKVNIPVLGVVENMAMHLCSRCGHLEPIFGEGGGERLAAQYGVNLLVSLPLAMSIRQQADGGKPTAIAEPDGEIARIYQQMARNVGARLALSKQNTTQPSISIDED